MRFVLIDRLTVLELGKRAAAQVTFSPEADFLADHFPGFPVVPGVLLTEAMGQTAGWLLACTLGFSRWPLLVMIDRAKFHRFVRPGQPVDLEAELCVARERDFDVRASASVEGKRVARARLLFHAIEEPASEPDAARFKAWAETTFRQIGGDQLLAHTPRPG